MKKNNVYLWLICMVSAMGGLLFGYDWVVIGGAKIFYEPFFNLEGSPALRGWAMSSALVGCLVGALLSGSWSNSLWPEKNVDYRISLVCVVSLWDRCSR